jgi:hypothetical protein
VVLPPRLGEGAMPERSLCVTGDRPGIHRYSEDGVSESEYSDPTRRGEEAPADYAARSVRLPPLPRRPPPSPGGRGEDFSPSSARSEGGGDGSP